MRRETKAFTFQVKAVNDELGLIEAYGSVFDIPDEGDDVVRPGAFKRTIQNSKARVQAGKAKFLAVMLWQHDPHQPIGGWTDLEEDAHGLKCTGQIILTTQLGREVYELIKAGVINEFSIGYDILSGGASYDKSTGYRNLKELRLWEISPVTFAMQPEALLTGVKSACGSTSWPLADRDTAWSGSNAHSQIVKWASNDDGSLDQSKMKSVHFWYDPDSASHVTAYKLPFCYIENNTPVAVPKGVFGCAAVMQGARGGADIDDEDAVKSKIAMYYRKMAKAFDDDSIKVPWSDGKSSEREIEKKDFNDHYRQEAVEDWLYYEFKNLTCALYKALIDAFMIGDSPQDDVITTILSDSHANAPGFVSTLEAWVQRGVQLGASHYLQETLEAHGIDGETNVGYPYGGYMSRRMTMETKVGRAISASNAEKIQAHVDSVKDMATKAMQMMQEHTKALNSAADDLATVLQGSEAAYGSDPGTPAPGQQEGKAVPYRSGTRGAPSHSSLFDQDTVSEQDIQQAIERLRSLRAETY